MAPFWVTPLLLLPGVALLVMSTQARYGQLHSEMHRLIEHHPTEESLAQDLIKRGRLFRNALISLYGACAVFGLGALLGGIAETTVSMAEWVAYPLTLVGCLLLVTASFMLVHEATLSFRILEYHERELQRGSPVVQSNSDSAAND